MNGILQWIQATTGIPPQAQASIVISLLSAYGMNAIHLTKEHERSVLSALFWGLDGVLGLMGKVKPIFNAEIQADIQAGMDQIANVESLVQAQQAQLDAQGLQLAAVHDAIKQLKPATSGGPA